MKPQPIEGVLIDIAGVLYVGDDPIHGASKALHRLQESNLPIRYVTNTTRSTRVRLMAKLRQMGFDIDSSSLFTAPIATLKSRQTSAVSSSGVPKLPTRPLLA